MSTPSRHHLPHPRAGRRRVVLGSLLLALAAAPVLPATTAGAAPPPGTPVLHRVAEVVSTPLGPGSNQGSEVALSADGSTLAVAGIRPYVDPQTAVVVYVRSGDDWLVQTTLRGSTTDPGANYWGTSIAISGDGDTLAVGDPRATVTADGTSLVAAGRVLLFTRSGETWSASGQIVSPQALFAGWFGTDVSLSADGTRLAVGTSSVSRQAFVADTGSHVVRKLPTPTGEVTFGRAVAISPDGTTVVVGAPYAPTHPRLGRAFIMVDDPVKGWAQRWHLEAQPGEEDSGFGTAVAVTDTDTVVVGAPGSHPGVSVFDRRGGGLVRTARFTPRYTTQAHRLGTSVAVTPDGSTVVAGAPDRDAGRFLFAGAGYRWVRSPGGGWSWAGLASVQHPNVREYQGQSTAISGDGRTVVLGAPGRKSAEGVRTGAAIVFSAVS